MAAARKRTAAQAGVVAEGSGGDSGAAKKHVEVTTTAAADRPRRSAKPTTRQNDTKAEESRVTKSKPKTKPKPVAKDSKVEEKGKGKGKGQVRHKQTARSSTGTPLPGRNKVQQKTGGAGIDRDAAPQGNATRRDEDAAEETKGKEDDDDEEDEGRPYWLMKAEPESRIEKGIDVKFSIHDLETRTVPEAWDGVRNPTARNNMRAMKKGDLAFFYHSNCKTPGIVGVMEIVQEHSFDESAFDESHPYFDAKSDKENPKWSVVHVEHRMTFPEMVSLKEMQKHSSQGEALNDMQVLRMSRLSVSKVSRKQWKFILEELAHIDAQNLQERK